MSIESLNQNNFKLGYKNNQKWLMVTGIPKCDLYVVYVYQLKCPHCITFNNVYIQLAKRFPNISFGQIEVGNKLNNNLLMIAMETTPFKYKQEITGTPTLLIFNGRDNYLLAKYNSGDMSLETISKNLTEMCTKLGFNPIQQQQQQQSMYMSPSNAFNSAISSPYNIPMGMTMPMGMGMLDQTTNNNRYNSYNNTNRHPKMGVEDNVIYTDDKKLLENNLFKVTVDKPWFADTQLYNI